MHWACSQVDSLPSFVVGNDPLDVPLAILNFKRIIVDGSSQCQVLVQWEGLSPDDTSQEDWTTLKVAYNLGDKVNFDAGNIDMSKPSVKEQLNKANDPMIKEVESMINRTVVTPKKWKDFVLYQQRKI